METIEVTPLTPKQIIIRYGLIAAGCAILVYVLFYAFNEDLLLDQVWSVLPVAILVIIGLLAALKRKQIQAGYMRYGESVATSMGVLGIGFIIHLIFSILLFYVIDPSLSIKRQNMILDTYDTMVKSGKMTKEAFDKMSDYVSHPSVGIIIIGLVGQILFIGIIGLVVYLLASIFIKNESPFKKESV